MDWLYYIIRYLKIQWIATSFWRGCDGNPSALGFVDRFWRRCDGNPSALGESVTGNAARSALPTALGGTRLGVRARDTADRIASRFGCLNERRAYGSCSLPFRSYIEKGHPSGCPFSMELVTGIEPATCSLRMSCSAIEPHQHFALIYFNKKLIAGQHFL